MNIRSHWNISIMIFIQSLCCLYPDIPLCTLVLGGDKLLSPQWTFELKRANKFGQIVVRQPPHVYIQNTKQSTQSTENEIWNTKYSTQSMRGVKNILLNQTNSKCLWIKNMFVWISPLDLTDSRVKVQHFAQAKHFISTMQFNRDDWLDEGSKSLPDPTHILEVCQNERHFFYFSKICDLSVADYFL